MVADEAREVGRGQDGLAAGEAAHRRDRLAADHRVGGRRLARDDQREALRAAVRLRVGERLVEIAGAGEAAAAEAAATAAARSEAGRPAAVPEAEALRLLAVPEARRATVPEAREATWRPAAEPAAPAEEAAAEAVPR